jgi:hypothetical protein
MTAADMAEGYGPIFDVLKHDADRLLVAKYRKASRRN